jgi:hypothetical protein
MLCGGGGGQACAVAVIEQSPRRHMAAMMQCSGVCKYQLAACNTTHLVIITRPFDARDFGVQKRLHTRRDNIHKTEVAIMT